MTAEENSSIREVISQEPKTTTRSFVNPGVPPVKPMPSIKIMMGAADAEPEKPAPVPEPAPGEIERKQSPPTPEEPAPDDIEYETPLDDEPDQGDEDDVDAFSSEPPQDGNPRVETSVGDKEEEDFAVCWNLLFETLFSGNHLIYYSLKDETPRYENDVINIEVKNNIQKELIETSMTAILEYWRNHFSLNVDDLEITVNEQKESKKVIVNSEDKMSNMADQNGQLMDFLNILKFSIKD